MIPQAIENVIRDFDFHDYGMPDEVIDPTSPNAEWVAVLADQIAMVVQEEITEALRVALFPEPEV